MLGIVKTQGFEDAPSAHAAPVTFQPENVQPATGVAVTFSCCPTGSEHPDGHAGVKVPSPTTAVVNMGHSPGAQLIVTTRAGACLISPCTEPLTATVYCVPGVAARASTTSVVTKDGNPDDWANDVDSCPSAGETTEVKLTFCGEPETNETVT
jgi:hypothetical protein